MKKFTLALALALSASALMAQDLMVVQAGDGTAALSSGSTACFLKRYTTAGSFVSSISMPIAPSGANQALTLAGTASSEGFLTLSGNGQYLLMAGYGVAPGTPTVAGTTAAAVNRIIGRIDGAGNVDTSTALGDAYNAGNPRSAASLDGSSFWMSGTGSSGAGVRYISALGATTSLQLSTAPTNIRVVNIQNGQLYFSSASGTFQGVSTCGTGVPTTAGQTCTILPGFPTATGPSPYDFWFASATTVYVADDRLVASGGGIQRWDQTAGTWNLTYTMNVSLPAGCRGLCGSIVGGNAVLYATTAQASANNVVTVTDTGAASVFATLVSAPTNTAFRGIEFTPTAAEQTVLPSGFSVIAGTQGPGNLASLFNDDSDRLLVQCDEFDPNTGLEVTATSPLSTVSQLKFKVVLRASRTDMVQQIRLYSYLSNSFENFGAGNATLTDSTKMVTVTTDPSRFIDSTTREMKSQVLQTPTTEVDGFDGWNGGFNQTIWMVQ